VVTILILHRLLLIFFRWGREWYPHYSHYSEAGMKAQNASQGIISSFPLGGNKSPIFLLKIFWNYSSGGISVSLYGLKSVSVKIPNSIHDNQCWHAGGLGADSFFFFPPVVFGQGWIVIVWSFLLCQTDPLLTFWLDKMLFYWGLVSLHSLGCPDCFFLQLQVWDMN
jgi:hypothetical protein